MFHLLSLLRHRRTRCALIAAVASISLAALPSGAHADLVQGQPQNVVGGFFDDHSIGGDNHLGWGYTGTGGTSQAEPLAITFGTTLTNTGPDQFRVCGYNAAGGWMAAYQVAAATCPGHCGRRRRAGRLVPLRDGEPQRADRDAGRLRVQPLAPHGPPALRARPAADLARRPGRGVHRVGHDLGHVPQRRRPDDGLRSGRGRRPRRLPPQSRRGAAKTTQELNPAPDAERIAIPAEARAAFPDGAYQIVAISNPYGQYGGGPSISCTTISVSGSDRVRPAGDAGRRPAGHVLRPGGDARRPDGPRWP